METSSRLCLSFTVRPHIRLLHISTGLTLVLETSDLMFYSVFPDVDVIQVTLCKAVVESCFLLSISF